MNPLDVVAPGGSATVWAADPSPLPEQPPIDPALVTPGLLGLAAFLFLIVAVALLYRSMRNQLRKVDPQLPQDPPREPQIPIVDAAPAQPDSSSGGEPPARS